jgi:hypothetical protein
MWICWTRTIPWVLESPDEIKELVLKGKRPEPACPEGCPTWMGDLMALCWDEEEANRPTFDDIVVRCPLRFRQVLDVYFKWHHAAWQAWPCPPSLCHSSIGLCVVCVHYDGPRLLGVYVNKRAALKS